jgi:hypothetical protein
LLGVIIVVAACHRATLAPAPPPRSAVQQQRVDLINAVLAARRDMFGQTAMLSACRLARAVGDSTRDPRSFLRDTAIRRNVRGSVSDCGKTDRFSPNLQTVIVDFTDFREERNEWIDPGPEWHVTHPANLVVVRIRVYSSVLALAHVEEWVMGHTVRENWLAYNVRILHVMTW